MLPYRDSRITYIALVIFFLIVLGYGYFEARGLLFGPTITVTSSVTEVHDPFVSIKGHADRIATLQMNGKTISVTEDGAFEEPYLLSAGYNRIVLDAKDKYGRSRSQVIEIVYTPSSAEASAKANSETSSTMPFASSTTPIAQ